MEEDLKRTCPICGRTFEIPWCDDWVYKRKKYGGGGYEYYCRWNCFREEESRREKKKAMTLEEANRSPWARKEPIDSRELAEKLMEIIAEDGPEAAAGHLESLGYTAWKKWYNLKIWAEKHDPGMRKKMPEKLTDRRRKDA